ncbi:MAG: hypothetical protein M3Y72_18670 [Acidobacteriota bacterium]|nr:hypothetical protein [Acidobacteriota bacterium]MDQ2843020.1 hypothetical protein [Acidobacteriota bacterium]
MNAFAPTLSVRLPDMKRYSLGVIPFRPARSARLALPFAASPDMRAAQISVFPEFASVQPFPHERWRDLGAFRPSVLVGYGLDLQRLAEKVAKDDFELRTIDHAIFALTDCGSAPVSDVLRVTLWQRFGVPVYELIVAPGCRLLAFECEAHDGWHVADNAVPYLVMGELVCDFPPLANLHTDFSGQINPKPCACGRRSVRLKNLAPHIRKPYEHPLAAIA